MFSITADPKVFPQRHSLDRALFLTMVIVVWP
jgi:hypothetical protein